MIPSEEEPEKDRLPSSSAPNGSDVDDHAVVALAADEEAQMGVLAKSDTVASSIQPPVTIYTEHERYVITAIAAWGAFFSTVSVPIYLPAFSVLGQQFHVDTEKLNLTVTVYSIFQGLSPAFFGALSDAIGRRPVYIICFSVYIGACIGLALSKSYWMLFGLRMLQASGIASTVAIMNGVIADITSRRNRGAYVGVASGIGLVGNCFGPLIGGAITGSLGWRAIFWFLVITCSVTLVAVAVILPETNRFIAGDGSIYPSSIINQSPYAFFRRRIKGVPYKPGDAGYDGSGLQASHPIKFLGVIDLLREVDVVMILIPNALHYTTWFMVLTTMSTLLSTEYGFDSTKVGFSYLASGVGSFMGSFGSGRLMTYMYRKTVREYKADCAAKGIPVDMREFTIQKARLGASIYASIALALSCILYGWTIQKHVHYVVPILATFVTSSTCTYVVNTSSTLIVDLFPDESASATAVVNLSRCLLCAAGLAIVDKMVNALGAGGAFTLMAGICVVSMSLVLLEIRIGQNIDRKRRQRLHSKNQRI